MDGSIGRKTGLEKKKKKGGGGFCLGFYGIYGPWIISFYEKTTDEFQRTRSQVLACCIFFFDVYKPSSYCTVVVDCSSLVEACLDAGYRCELRRHSGCAVVVLQKRENGKDSVRVRASSGTGNLEICR